MIDDEQFQQILAHFDLSWKGYRKIRKGVKKRLTKHMHSLGLDTAQEYLITANRNPMLMDEIRRLLTVSISRFFRDRQMWDDLRRFVFPLLVENESFVQVWSAGCASGEEPYSFSMLWHGFSRTMPTAPRICIQATDSNAHMIERAQAGLYHRSSLREVDKATLETCFRPTRQEDISAIAPFVRQSVDFRVHDFTRDDPPGDAFHVIFLRNSLLTYYSGESREAAFNKIVKSLRFGGFLVIGTHEEIPAECRTLIPSTYNRCILVKETDCGFDARNPGLY
ncbi:CheR family methyltransferase [Desulfomonile tiedjei]|uniref:Methylase of chemotaxis methyl-accepting protein n=1 Tax=Desulfomonile tiedjei (strain ATCC 49306 / DSM 6799 / DCB-1) TaxID=706587 RepID=I4CAP3_DESTA|nr:CheR family methyltransferase [Desulfomonile tiedjei]AFM26634.1 methylase of chemotaxis methyl-accepting protein [Desulfomonile tiedjei DSM 6799]